MQPSFAVKEKAKITAKAEVRFTPYANTKIKCWKMKALIYLGLVGIVLFEVCSGQSCSDLEMLNETLASCLPNVTCTNGICTCCINVLNAGLMDDNGDAYECCETYSILVECGANYVEPCDGLPGSELSPSSTPSPIPCSSQALGNGGHSVSTTAVPVGSWTLIFLLVYCS